MAAIQQELEIRFQTYSKLSPVQPRLNTLYTSASGFVTLSLIVQNQESPCTKTPKMISMWIWQTSQRSGELKFTHNDPN